MPCVRVEKTKLRTCLLAQYHVVGRYLWKGLELEMLGTSVRLGRRGSRNELYKLNGGRAREEQGPSLVDGQTRYRQTMEGGGLDKVN